MPEWISDGMWMLVARDVAVGRESTHAGNTWDYGCASFRTVSGSGSLLKNLAKVCSKTEPGGEILEKRPPNLSRGVLVRITLRGQEPAKIVRVGLVGLLWGGH
jgi:hypothetical protein